MMLYAPHTQHMHCTHSVDALYTHAHMHAMTAHAQTHTHTHARTK